MGPVEGKTSDTTSFREPWEHVSRRRDHYAGKILQNGGVGFFSKVLEGPGSECWSLIHFLSISRLPFFIAAYSQMHFPLKPESIHRLPSHICTSPYPPRAFMGPSFDIPFAVRSAVGSVLRSPLDPLTISHPRPLWIVIRQPYGMLPQVLLINFLQLLL